MKARRRLATLVLAVLLVLGLVPVAAGCTGASNKVTLTMVESLTSPQRTEKLKSFIKKYQDANPNVTIELISPPMDGADQKIRQMLMNKNDIDILEVRDWTVKEFSNNNYLVPLDDYVKAWDGSKTLTKTVTLAGTMVGGKYYLIPYGFYQKMIFYRQDWLKEAGIAKPTTWDELLAAAEKLTNPEKGRYGWTLRGVNGGYGVMTGIIIDKLGTKGVVLDDNYYTPDGKTIFSTPEALEAFNTMIALYTKASPKDSISWGFQDQCQAFTSGVTAFLMQDPEVVAICQEQMDEGTWGTMPLPVDAKSQQSGANIGYAGWGIAANCKYKDEAWKFIAFLSNADNNAEFCASYSVIPIHSNAAEKNAFFKSGPFAPYIEMSSKPDNFFIYHGTENYSKLTQFGETAQSDYQNVLQGKADAATVLKAWDAFWTDALKTGK